MRASEADSNSNPFWLAAAMIKAVMGMKARAGCLELPREVVLNV